MTMEIVNNRPPKFRCWCIDSKRMLTDPVIDNWDGRLHTLNDHLARPGFKYLQYTGLYDKNGKEIYEADIVAELVDKSLDGLLTRYVGITQVIFQSGCFGLKYSTDGFVTFWNMELESTERICAEIIGNIYENPELLL